MKKEPTRFERTDLTLEMFTKVAQTYVKPQPDCSGNFVGTRFVDVRAACPFREGTLIGSDVCFACKHNRRLHYNENLPPWTVECAKQGERIAHERRTLRS